jgi:hypothetical protein
LIIKKHSARSNARVLEREISIDKMDIMPL